MGAIPRVVLPILIHSSGMSSQVMGVSTADNIFPSAVQFPPFDFFFLFIRPLIPKERIRLKLPRGPLAMFGKLAQWVNKTE